VLSVIIPTHKRAAILRKCLEQLEGQTVARDLEVIVVSDGHDAETVKQMADDRWQVAVRFLEIPKSQQGAARNQGIRAARGEYCLFIGDDIFLAPNACEVHLKTHDQSPIAVLGFTTWDPSVGITPVMRWLERTGWQFGYGKIARYAHAFIPRELQHRFTYTSHLSLPTTIALEIPFRDDITSYGWEDIEWGLRLRDAGVRLFYDPSARALHHHHVTLEESLARMETLGRSVVSLSRLNPHLDRMPRGWKLRAYQLLSLLPTLRGLHARAFLHGIERGKKAS